MIKYLFLLAVTIAGAGGLQAQEAAACLPLVKSLYKEINSGFQEKGLYLHYRVSSVFTNPHTGETESAQEEVRLYASGHKSRMESQFATIYKDSVSQVTILPERKTVMLSDVAKGPAQQKLNMMLQVQDSLFNYLVARECSAIQGRESGWVRAVFDGNAKLESRAGLKSITFILNVQTKILESIQMEYTPEKHQQEVVMEILAADYNYKNEIFNGSALEKVIQAGQQLRPPHASFRLVDVRKAN